LGISAVASEGAEPEAQEEVTPYILSKNVSYSSSIYLYYAVPKSSVPDGVAPKLVGTDALGSFVINEYHEDTVLGEACYIFVTRGVAAKDLNSLRASRFTSGGSISLNADNYLKAISDERVRELYMEGFRLNDLKRWGTLYNNGGGFKRTPQSHSLPEGSSLEVKADNPLFVWPIPQHEIEAPGSQVQPNESNR
jgi:hypothetical protein